MLLFQSLFLLGQSHQVLHKPILAERHTLLTNLATDYQKLVQSREGVPGLLKQYGVEYIVWDKNKNMEWDLSVFPGLEEIINYRDIYLYRANY